MVNGLPAVPRRRPLAGKAVRQQHSGTFVGEAALRCFPKTKSRSNSFRASIRPQPDRRFDAPGIDRELAVGLAAPVGLCAVRPIAKAPDQHGKATKRFEPGVGERAGAAHIEDPVRGAANAAAWAKAPDGIAQRDRDHVTFDRGQHCLDGTRRRSTHGRVEDYERRRSNIKIGDHRLLMKAGSCAPEGHAPGAGATGKWRVSRLMHPAPNQRLAPGHAGAFGANGCGALVGGDAAYSFPHGAA
ncbi:MAG: hypothetical protein JWR80_9442 [Bradyrhizobium sp.]|nr:hypothetical protein [Bradyrhizobium sp.]